MGKFCELVVTLNVGKHYTVINNMLEVVWKGMVIISNSARKIQKF